MLQTFEQISLVFSMNMGSLRIFTQQLGMIADTYDQTYISSMAREFAEVLDENTEDIEANLRYFSTLYKLDDLPEEEKELIEEIKNADKLELAEKIEEWGRNEPEKYRKLNSQFQNMLGQNPAHGILIRRGALMILISFWEALVSALVKKYYSLFTSALNTDNRVISLDELLIFGSIEKVKEHFIHQEADSVVRKSFQKQLDYFSNRLHVDLLPIKIYVEKFQEVTQRRNLLVHNNGIVNKIYLSNISDSLKNKYKPKLGKRLEVPDAYLSEAIEILQTLGTVLLHICWKKWKKGDLNKADEHLNGLIGRSLIFERFTLVENIAKYAIEQPLISKKSVKKIIINYAIALRDTGKHERMESLLKKLDLKENEIIIKIAYYTLLEDYDKVYELLPQALKKNAISSLAKDWPLFKPIRNRQRFLDCFY